LQGDTKVGVIFILEGFAALAVSEREWEKALKLFSWAAQHREDNGEPRPPVEQAVVDRELLAIQKELTETAMTGLAAEGCSMSIEQAVALALDENHG